MTPEPIDRDPLPPKLHWAVVFILGLVTLGVFTSIWAVVQALWIKKIDPPSRAIQWMGAHWLLAVAAGIASRWPDLLAFETLAVIASGICYITACFSMKYWLELYINRVTTARVSLNGTMTFFFGSTYLQYNMNVLRALIQLDYNIQS